MGRLAYETTEARLRREFEQYGAVVDVKVVEDSESKLPRGYAFVQMGSDEALKAAFRGANGRPMSRPRGQGQRSILEPPVSLALTLDWMSKFAFASISIRSPRALPRLASMCADASRIVFRAVLPGRNA